MTRKEVLVIPRNAVIVTSDEMQYVEGGNVFSFACKEV